MILIFANETVSLFTLPTSKPRTEFNIINLWASSSHTEGILLRISKDKTVSGGIEYLFPVFFIQQNIQITNKYFFQTTGTFNRIEANILQHDSNTH